MKWLPINFALLVALSVSPPAVAQKLNAKYSCTSNLYIGYYLPDDEIITRRGKNAACRVELVPSTKKWETDCTFFSLRANHEVELLSFENGLRFWMIKLIAINRILPNVKTLTVAKLANRKDIQFTLATGGNAYHGTCVSE
jgi:hypothetical protein